MIQLDRVSLPRPLLKSALVWLLGVCVLSIGCGNSRLDSIRPGWVVSQSNEYSQQPDIEDFEVATAFRFAYITTKQITGFEDSHKLMVQERANDFSFITERAVRSFSDSDEVRDAKLTSAGEEVVYIRKKEGEIGVFKVDVHTGEETEVSLIMDSVPWLVNSFWYGWFMYGSDFALTVISTADYGTRWVYKYVYHFPDYYQSSPSVLRMIKEEFPDDSDNVQHHHENAYAYNPVYRPLSNEVYYITYNKNGPYEMYRATSGVLTDSKLVMTSHEKDIRGLTFLPDGSMFIVSRANLFGDGARNLFMYLVDGSEEEQITLNGSDILNYSPSVVAY